VNTIFRYFIIISLLAVAGDLVAANVTNLTTQLQEPWESISNRWGSLQMESVKTAGTNGDVTAQYYLGYTYDEGLVVTKDPQEALKWMQMAALQGMASAQRKLGWMYQSGSGTESDLSQALNWYLKASAQGDAPANVNIGWMYENGAGMPQDYAEAAKYYRLAAEKGHALGENHLGWLYLHGTGVDEDNHEAMKLFTKAAEQGNSLAQENLAWMYAVGTYGATNHYGSGMRAQILSGGNPPDHELAEKWMRQAVDLTAAEGQYKFANLLYDEFDTNGFQDQTRFPDAGMWFRKSADQGYVLAEFQLAEMYNAGQLGADQRSNCIPWYLKAAAQGNADAQARVGELPVLYPNNPLLKPVNNIDTLRQSAQSGNFEAQYQLARRYQFGMGVSKDAAQAFYWMQQAAQNANQDGNSKQGDAIYHLAVMYETGDGVAADLQKARELYLGAADPETFAQSDATYRVGRMYEMGEGVPKDDLKATEYYANETCVTNSQVPNGVINYLTPGDGGIEALARLWAQGRGFPSDDMKTKPGYRTPDSLLKYWEGSINTPSAEFYVGQIYWQGKLVPRDLIEADARLQIATNHGVSEAGTVLDQFQSKMSAAQKQAATARFTYLEDRFNQAVNLLRVQKIGTDAMPW
jgi:TPR repeat protein